MALVALGASRRRSFWMAAAFFGRNRGQRRLRLRRALAAGLVFAALLGTHLSVTIWWLNHELTPAKAVGFFLSPAVMLVGLLGSLACTVYAMLRAAGPQRGRLLSYRCWGSLYLRWALRLPFRDDARCVRRGGDVPLASLPSRHARQGGRTVAGLRSLKHRRHVVSLGGFAWKSGAVELFCDLCGPCQMELPHLQAIWDEFPAVTAISAWLSSGGRSPTKASETSGRDTVSPSPRPPIRTGRSIASLPRSRFHGLYLISRNGTIIYHAPVSTRRRFPS